MQPQLDTAEPALLEADVKATGDTLIRVHVIHDHPVQIHGLTDVC